MSRAEAKELELAPSIRAALDEGKFVGTAVGFRMMALSFVADACAAEGADDAALRESARRCVAKALERARGLRKRNAGLAESGLWLTHLNLILGAAHRVGPCLDEKEHAKASRTLAARSLADPHAHAASFEGEPRRWPADQSATLASLVRFDHAHGMTLAVEPVARFRREIERATRSDLGLPWSEVTGHARYGRQPRGCALAYETIYLREVDEAMARRYWERFKEHFLVERLALVGFREWPPGVEGPADSDSGPIVRGVGAAATAFAIPAARAMGDRLLAARLVSTANVVEQAARFNDKLARASKSTLADAIRLLGAAPR